MAHGEVRDETGSAGGRAGDKRAELPKGPVAIFLRAARAPFLTASAMPVLIGSTLPFWLRPAGFAWSWLHFVEALIGVVLLHAAANLSNCYYDHLSGADPSNPNPNVMSGGSGLLTEGVVEPRYFLRSAIVCFAIAAAIGLHLNFVLPGNTVLILGAIAIVVAHFYTAPPVKLCYRGLGEVAVGLTFGILPVVGAYFVQAGEISWRVVLASLPITFAVVLILWVNQVVDYVPDRDAGKRTFAVVLGPKMAGRAAVLALALLIFGSLFVAVFTGALIPLTLVTVLAFGLIRTVVADCWNNYDSPSKLAEASFSAIKLHLILGVIIAGSALAAMGN